MPKGPAHDHHSTLEAKRAPAARAHGVGVRVTRGADAGKAQTFAKTTVVIGRGETADFRLTDPTVSSFHLEVSSHARGVAIRDLGSKNAALFGGAEIARAIVPPGSALTLGDTVVAVDLGEPVAARAGAVTSFGELRGTGDAMRDLFDVLARLAKTELSVLVEGETGTGKELAARGLHSAGARARQPFVVLDCTAIPAALAESVLFGHEKGAFTGANERRIGVFEAADGGTLFLDEVGELPVELQPKLLRVLERREIVRVGQTKPRAVDVRIVSATWRDLRVLINQSRFREDLYYRLAQARVVMPSLGGRGEDISALIRHFLERLPDGSPGARDIAPDALLELVRRSYPGNVRELKATVERTAMLAAGSVISMSDLAFERLLRVERAPTVSERSAPKSARHGEELVPFKEAKRTLIDEFERDYLKRLLARTGSNLTRASALAQVERHHLRDLFRKHGLRSSSD